MPTLDNTTLQETLDTLADTQASNNTAASAILALTKTIQSRNITIEDWNSIVNFVHTNKVYLDTLYEQLPDLMTALYTALQETIDSFDNTITNLGNRVGTAESDISTLQRTKQDTLVSGQNIATVNHLDLLANENIEIEGINIDDALSTTSTNAVQNKVISAVKDIIGCDLSRVNIQISDVRSK